MAPASDSFTDQTVADTIAAPGVADVRGALLCALEAQGVCVNTAVDVAGLTIPRTMTSADPRLRLLGEQTPAVDGDDGEPVMTSNTEKQVIFIQNAIPPLRDGNTCCRRRRRSRIRNRVALPRGARSS